MNLVISSVSVVNLSGLTKCEGWCGWWLCGWCSAPTDFVCTGGVALRSGEEHSLGTSGRCESSCRSEEVGMSRIDELLELGFCFNLFVEFDENISPPN